MKKRIFSGMFTICLTVLAVCILIVAGFLYNYYSDKQADDLYTELSYLTHMAEEHNAEHIYSLDTPRQVVIADKNSNILSYGTDTDPTQFSSALEKAVSEATENGEGRASAHISIEKRQMCMSALLSDGTVLCIFDTYYTFPALIFNMSGYILLVLAVAALLSLLLSRVLSNRILRPVYEMDLTYPDKSKVYPELLPFVDKVREKNTEIRDRISALEDEHKHQDKLRREFTANVSHELKTPLTSISGYAEIIRDGMVQPQDVPVFAGRIHDESKRMINLVGDIIKLSQQDDNEISVKIERINLYDCCQAVINSLEPQAKKRNITINLSGDKAEISGGEIIIEEIIHNILDNAVKYNKENGSVDVNLRQCIDGVELTVKDTGIGISEDDLPHIFERFYRADKSHSKEIGGTGLGLSIVKHGAMFHNAPISIDSELGVGTTVRILF
ncbi:MAG: hypothetical protein IJC86_05110 [Clostridia bacterium]|nr:hypothetical protein [Clostridia bacterium]